MTQIVRKGNTTYGIGPQGLVIKYEMGQTYVIGGGVRITSIDVADDGTVYMADANAHVVRVRYPDGTTGIVAGNGQTALLREDAANATQTAFNRPTYVKIGPDGLLYVMDEGIVRRIEADGSTTHLLGEFGATAQNDPYVEGGVATEHYFYTGTSASGGVPNDVHRMAFDSSGRLYVTFQLWIFVVNLDGTVHTFFQPTEEPYTVEDTSLSEKMLASPYGDMAGFDIAPDDSLWLSVSNKEPVYNQDGSFRYTLSAVVRIKDGMAYTAAGGGNGPGDNTTPAYGHQVNLAGVYGLSVGDDGNIYFINAGTVFNPYQTFTGQYIGRLSLNTDVTPPEISYSLSIEPNEYGWHNTPVEIAWMVNDNESAITYQQGCETTVMDTDISSYSQLCQAISNGGYNAVSASFNIDTSAPTITAINFEQEDDRVRVSAHDNDPGSGPRLGEYFLGNDDPGVGNGTAFYVSAYLGNNTFALDAPIGLSPGEYVFNTRVQDYAGNWSTTNTQTIEVEANTDPVTFNLTASQDTGVRSGQANRNYGGDSAIRIQSSGDNRGMIKFDQAAIASGVGDGTIFSVKLRLTITDNGNNWGSTGRTIAMHRLLLGWLEGNGTEDDRGSGLGATWACAVDILIENQAKNCSGSAEWEMGQPSNPSVHPWFETATATQTITNNQSGVVEFDVTADVIAFLNGDFDNYGWLIKKTNEGQNGQVNFGTRESAFAPELVITYQP